MTDTHNLAALAKAVEAGIGHYEWLDYDDALPHDQLFAARDAYKGDLDAAVRLVETMLPGWFVTITRLCEDFDGSTVTLVPSDWRAEVSDGWLGWPDDDDPEKHLFDADSPNPARALLLAVLRAKMGAR